MTTSAINPPACRWCGFSHPERVCHLVRAIEYHDDGVTVKRVEFHAPQSLAAADARLYGIGITRIDPADFLVKPHSK